MWKMQKEAVQIILDHIQDHNERKKEYIELAREILSQGPD